MRSVIFLNGPIGVGKSTLGLELAQRLGGMFIDSDDLRDHSKTWLEEVLSGSKRLVRSGMAALSHRPLLIIAKPLRDRDWAFFRAAFRAEGVATFCVTLAASRDSILADSRGRKFSPGERARIAEMLSQGYAERPFSDLIVETDQASFADTLTRLTEACRALLGRARPGAEVIR